jgi:molecular chaperone DnaK
MILRLAAALVLLAGCRKSEPSFDACYQRCINPPPSECRPGHAWCIVACRGSTTSSPLVTARLKAESEAPPMSILAHDVSIETFGGVATPLIRRCTELPAEMTEMFSTAMDNQQNVELTMVTGDSPRATDNQLLGRFQLQGIRLAPRGIPKIDVQIRLEKNGVLHVSAKDRDTGAAQDISILQTRK